MNTLVRKIVAPFCIVSAMASQPALAAGSVQHIGEASTHAAQAGGHSLAAGGKTVAGVVAVPLMAVGELGAVSGEAGGALWEQASGEPLPVTEETITSAPSPAAAMQAGGGI